MSESASTPAGICPPIRSFASGAPPLYAIWTISTPVTLPTMRPKKCGRLPGAGEPKFACVGLVFSHATNSGTVFAGWPGLTANANWYVATCATGAKSLAGS